MREIYGVARVMLRRGEYAQADPLALSVYESNKRLLGPDHFKTLSSDRTLASIYAEEAEPLRRELEASADSVCNNSPADLIATRQALGENLIHQQRCSNAEPFLKTANRLWSASSSSDWRR